ncbi:MAG TPA: MarR family transcriptional regulator [Ghiorsea sp.]|nr:MarR family transcriptional regulator [Ghiorsea sp.]
MIKVRVREEHMGELNQFKFEQVLGFYINRVSYLMTEEIEKRFKAAGLNIVAQEFAILMRLFQEGNVPQATIIKLMMRDKTTITRRVNGLVKKGLVQRVMSPEDRRCFNIQLTGEGKEALEIAFPMAMGFQQELVAGVSPEDREVTVKVLQQLAQTLMDLK